jgi:hypothetical protein
MMISKKTAMFFFFTVCLMKIYGQQYSSGFRALVYGNHTIINVTTPEKWVCDYQFAESFNFPCAFLQETAYSNQGIDTTHYMYINFEERKSSTPEEFLEFDLDNYRKHGYNPTVKKIDFTMEQGKNIKDYGLYEFMGLPNTYKELVLILQTDVSNVVAVYGYMFGDVQTMRQEIEKLEQTYQEKITGFYELIKTLEIKIAKNIYPQGNGFILFDE